MLNLTEPSSSNASNKSGGSNGAAGNAKNDKKKSKNNNPNNSNPNNNPSSGDNDDDILNGLPTIDPNSVNKLPFGIQVFETPDESNGFNPEDMMINYNKKFKKGEPVLFRDNIVQQVLSCLIGKFKPNALLIGAAGVGKTKIVEDIAKKIANNDLLIPDTLKGYTIWELPLSSIVANSGLVGSLESKVLDVINYASNPKNKAILFIDEIHVLIGQSTVYEKIAQMLKPAMARGDIKVIGATTLQEVQNLMNDPAFNRRFTRLIVDELSQEQTKEILKKMSTSMFRHYEKKVRLTGKTIDAIISTADEFKTAGSHRPDNAITLMDRAMANALIERKVTEAIANKKKDTDTLHALSTIPVITLSKSQIKKTAMKIMTGNNEKADIDINLLKERLAVIKGQDKAINYLLDTLERDSLNIFPKKKTKPLTILFAGNSGVGKTAIAKILANVVTNADPIILNMTEYHSSASINRIIGSPDGYIGSDSKKEFPFDILESNPYQIILLDEFEKSDISVQRLFMSAFDEGYIKASSGKIIDFSKATIIATTNAGNTKRSEKIGFDTGDENENETSIKDLSQYFDIELLNRFTKILNFNPITEKLYKDILKDLYARYVADIKVHHSTYSFLSDELSDEDTDTLCKNTYVKELGARPVEKTIQKFIEDIILENIHKND